jgi:hypothetical protein
LKLAFAPAVVDAVLAESDEELALELALLFELCTLPWDAAFRD